MRESYRQTLARFLTFCAQRKEAASVRLAREFVELARLEQAPGPARLPEWKDALNWYFRRGREAGAMVVRGVPPLARTDQGQTAWEQALIAGVRERHLAWRTEQAYRGWLWRFVRWLGDRRKKTSNTEPRTSNLEQGVSAEAGTTNGEAPLADVGAGEVKAFLSRLAVPSHAARGRAPAQDAKKPHPRG